MNEEPKNPVLRHLPLHHLGKVVRPNLGVQLNHQWKKDPNHFQCALDVRNNVKVRSEEPQLKRLSLPLASDNPMAQAVQTIGLNLILDAF
jgi:hypothetical protein